MRLKIGIVGVLLLVFINGITIKAAPKTMPDGGVFDPEYYAATYPDVKAAFGTNESLLYQHYLRFGKAEGRQPFAPGSTVTPTAQGATVQPTNTITPEQAVSIAYQEYIKKGMASDAAFTQVQANLVAITSLKTEAEIVQYVNGTTSAINTPTPTPPTSAPIPFAINVNGILVTTENGTNTVTSRSGTVQLVDAVQIRSNYKKRISIKLMPISTNSTYTKIFVELKAYDANGFEIDSSALNVFPVGQMFTTTFFVPNETAVIKLVQR